MAEQGDLPTLEHSPMELLNAARFQAYRYAGDAVVFLYAVMNDEDEDTDRRILAADAILNFARVP